MSVIHQRIGITFYLWIFDCWTILVLQNPRISTDFDFSWLIEWFYTKNASKFENCMNCTVMFTFLRNCWGVLLRVVTGSLVKLVECSPIARETRVHSQVESYQMVLGTSLLNTQHYKVRIKVKWSNWGKGVTPSPTPWCSSYRKESLRVTLVYGHQLYFIWEIQ